jgi:superfamily II DNA/RNA helicase
MAMTNRAGRAGRAGGAGKAGQAITLTHVDARGRVKMVDVGDKPVTNREAIVTFQRALQERVAALPGVSGTGMCRLDGLPWR